MVEIKEYPDHLAASMAQVAATTFSAMQTGAHDLVKRDRAAKIGNWCGNETRPRDVCVCLRLGSAPLECTNVMGCFGSAGARTDPDENKRRKEANKKINKQIQRDKQVYRATHRLLLLGKYIYLSSAWRPYWNFLSYFLILLYNITNVYVS